MSDEFILKGMVEKWGDVKAIVEMAKKFDLEKLNSWVKICVGNAAKDKTHRYAFLLQELVNIIGERLGFSVIPGEWNKEGPDGIWERDEKRIVVETKASSFYMNFEKIVKYISSRKALSGIAASSEFSKDKVAAVKGEYAGKIRLVTIDGLLKLAELREKDVVSPDSVFDILVPQETIQLDGLIGLIHSIFETKSETVVAGKEGEKDIFDINDVPEEITDLGDVAKAMYIILRKNPEKTFESWELTEEMSKAFPEAFSETNPGLGIVWSGDSLKHRDLIAIERYKPDPMNYPEWYKRRYRFKK
jgi:hypothetical protein